MKEKVTLGTKCSMKIDGELAQMDPQVTVPMTYHCFKGIQKHKYELCSHPPALFDTSHTQTAQQTSTCKAIWATLMPGMSGPSGEV